MHGTACCVYRIRTQSNSMLAPARRTPLGDELVGGVVALVVGVAAHAGKQVGLRGVGAPVADIHQRPVQLVQAHLRARDGAHALHSRRLACIIWGGHMSMRCMRPAHVLHKAREQTFRRPSCSAMYLNMHCQHLQHEMGMALGSMLRVGQWLAQLNWPCRRHQAHVTQLPCCGPRQLRPVASAQGMLSSPSNRARSGWLGHTAPLMANRSAQLMGWPGSTFSITCLAACAGSDMPPSRALPPQEMALAARVSRTGRRLLGPLRARMLLLHDGMGGMRTHTSGKAKRCRPPLEGQSNSKRMEPFALRARAVFKVRPTSAKRGSCALHAKSFRAPDGHREQRL